MTTILAQTILVIQCLAANSKTMAHVQRLDAHLGSSRTASNHGQRVVTVSRLARNSEMRDLLVPAQAAVSVRAPARLSSPLLGAGAGLRYAEHNKSCCARPLLLISTRASEAIRSPLLAMWLPRLTSHSRAVTERRSWQKLRSLTGSITWVAIMPTEAPEGVCGKIDSVTFVA